MVLRWRSQHTIATGEASITAASAYQREEDAYRRRREQVLAELERSEGAESREGTQ
jgi:hypothetical protein